MIHSEMMDRMSVDEFYDWMIIFRHKLFDSDREDAAAIESVPQTPEQQLAILDSWMRG